MVSNERQGSSSSVELQPLVMGQESTSTSGLLPKAPSTSKLWKADCYPPDSRLPSFLQSTLLRTYLKNLFFIGLW
jgi:hypothetical protein